MLLLSKQYQFDVFFNFNYRNLLKTFTQIILGNVYEIEKLKQHQLKTYVFDHQVVFSSPFFTVAGMIVLVRVYKNNNIA